LLAVYTKNLTIFKDTSDTSWQVGYAMSYITDGPMGQPESRISNPGAFFVWDHRRTPGCADTRAGHLGPPWTPFPPEADTAHTHYPDRHNRGFVALAVDTSVKWRSPKSITVNDFFAIR
jgi:hypothetical protein